MVHAFCATGCATTYSKLKAKQTSGTDSYLILNLLGTWLLYLPLVKILALVSTYAIKWSRLSRHECTEKRSYLLIDSPANTNIVCVISDYINLMMHIYYRYSMFILLTFDFMPQ